MNAVCYWLARCEDEGQTHVEIVKLAREQRPEDLVPEGAEPQAWWCQEIFGLEMEPGLWIHWEILGAHWRPQDWAHT